VYIPLRYKTATAARIAADVWYRVRGDRRGGRRRAAIAARLKNGCARRAFFGLDGDPSALQLPQSERVRILQTADQACRGHLHAPGVGVVACGDPIDWHRDPITGRRFPENFFDLTRDPSIDWKCRDEINLHRHFYTLGQAYYLSGEQRFATTALQQLASWLGANPPVQERFWFSALQCAVRVVAWVWLLNLLGRRGALGIDEEVLLVDAIREHARFIERHSQPTAHSYNHLIGEAAALAVVGLSLPDLPESERWRETGLKILAHEATRQFSQDGGHREQSTGYHVFVLEAYTHVVVLCRRNGVTVDPAITTTLEHMYQFVLQLMRPDGMLPNLGDEGLHWHRLSDRRLRDARCLLSTGAVLFERPDMKWAARTLSAESQWLLGSEGLERFDRLTARPPTAASCCLSDTGLAVWRSGWEESDHYFLLDAGAQGIGPAGHGHADALSVEVCAQGVPLVVDSGTYTYNMCGAGPWRRYFRGTSAHNTIRVDGEDQAVGGRDPFFWQQPAHAQLRRWYVNSLLHFADGAHAGYQRLPQPVQHRRLVFWVGCQYWVLWDILTGYGTHRCEIFFHFPDVSAELDEATDACSVGEGRARLRIVAFAEGALRGSLVRGVSDPPLGWVSRTYAHKEMAPVLVYSASSALPMVFATVLAPFQQDAAPAIRVSRQDVLVAGCPVDASAAGCMRVEVEGHPVDYLLWSDRSGEKTAADIATDGDVALVRVCPGRAPIGVRVGGAQLRWRGAPVVGQPGAWGEMEGALL